MKFVRSSNLKLFFLQACWSPLPIPELVWEDLAMDFIEGLPPSNGKMTIMVVVDRLSKFTHFLPIKYPFTAPQVVKVF